jgi:hypothetical protein
MKRKLTKQKIGEFVKKANSCLGSAKDPSRGKIQEALKVLSKIIFPIDFGFSERFCDIHEAITVPFVMLHLESTNVPEVEVPGYTPPVNPYRIKEPKSSVENMNKEWRIHLASLIRKLESCI